MHKKTALACACVALACACIGMCALALLCACAPLAGTLQRTVWSAGNEVSEISAKTRQSALRVTGEPLTGWYIDRLEGEEFDLFYAMYNAAARSKAGVGMGGAPFSAMFRALTALRYDCPELFHLTGNVDYSYGKDADGAQAVFRVTFEYAHSAGEYAAMLTDTLALLDEWKAAVSAMSELEAERYLYDAVLSRCEYEKGEGDSNAYGALMGGNAVCMGYAFALGLSLRYCAGLECLYVGGEANDPYEGGKEAHAWCIASINGAYCALDPTWDDMGAREGWLPAYFNLDDETMLKSRAYDAEYTDFAPLPKCETMEYEAYTAAGRFLAAEENAKAGVFAMLEEKKASGEGGIAFRVATRGQFDEIAENLSDWLNAWCEENDPGVSGYSAVLEDESLIVWVGDFQR